MPDEFTETSGQSIFARLGDAIKGLLVGLVLIPVSIALLFWNEGRAVKTATSLKEGASEVRSVDADPVNPANDGKLIHLGGEVTTKEVLDDDTFHASANALRLTRSVEMYQWKQEESSETHKQMGGGTETTKTYRYVKTWSKHPIPSSGFKHPENHANPASMMAAEATVTATNSRLGAFLIPVGIISKMSGDHPLTLSPADLERLPVDLKANARLQDNHFYFGNDPTNPAIGDQRISFTSLRPGTFSILARQTGATLEPYQTRAGREIERVESGMITADLMFRHAGEENSMWTWILRGGGMLLMWIGFVMILNPLVTMADVIPFLGDLLGAGAKFAALILSLIFSSVVTAIAWFAARPMLACILLAAGVGVFVAARSMSARKRAF